MENDNKDIIIFNGDSSFLKEKDPSLTHICDICGKGFSSGKAMGGHKRFHILQDRRAADGEVSGNNNGLLRRTNEFKMKAKNPQRGFISPLNILPEDKGNNNNNTCYVCDKDFSSTKALSGHMRSHPERGWRGIQPPAMLAVSDRISGFDDAREAKLDSDYEEKDKYEDDDDDDHYINNTVSTAAIPAVNLLEKLSASWSKTDRRGRTANPAVAAADGLIDLSRSESDWCLKKKLIKVKAVSENGTLLRFTTTTATVTGGTCNSEEKQVLNNIEPCDNSMKKKKTKYCLEEKKTKISNVSGSTETDQDNVSNKKVTATTTTNLYKCISCEKSFATYQALGGHRSTHNKDNKKGIIPFKKEMQAVETMNSKLTKICGESKGKVLSIGTTAEYLERPNNLGSRDVTGILPTELADLNMTDADQIASSSEVDALGGDSSTGDRRMLDFDLNELPCVMVGNNELL